MPFEIRKIRNENKYKVYNKITKKIHSYHTSKKNAIKQVWLLDHIIEGDGLFDNIQNFTTNVIYGRDDYSSKAKEILKKVGDWVVEGITILRTPVQSAIKKFITIYNT